MIASAHQQLFHAEIKANFSSNKAIINYPRTTVVFNGQSKPKSTEYYRKDVMVCAPIEAFPTIPFKCEKCHGLLCSKGWLTGEGRESRYVRCVNDGIYMIQRKYHCKICNEHSSGMDIVQRESTPEYCKAIISSSNFQ